MRGAIKFLDGLLLETFIFIQILRVIRKRENQRNHRVPEEIHNNWQSCACVLDCFRYCSFFAHQYSNWRGIPIDCAYYYLWSAQVSGLHATLLQLQKMHVWLRQTFSIVLWETQPKRLQIQLQITNSHLLLCLNRPISSSNPARQHNSSVCNS